MSKKEKQFKFSVVIPTYNMGNTIRQTINSIINQSYENFEIIIQDNNSRDNTKSIIESFSDSRIKYYKNHTNIGYARNLIEGYKNCNGDILYFVGADDIISKNALLETCRAFLKDKKIGAVTRPYYWFKDDIHIPVRLTCILNKKKDEIVYMHDLKKASIVIHNEILGQLSGLAFRIKFLKKIFFSRNNDWIAHGYPFIHIFKKYPVVFLKRYQVAIRIGNNIIRQKGGESYRISPIIRWINMLNEILTEKQFQEFKNYFIKNIIATNYLGLIQIRSYSKLSYLFREIWYLLKYNWLNIFNLNFYFYSLGCILVPKSILPRITDFYKDKINSRIIKKIYFKYNISCK